MRAGRISLFYVSVKSPRPARGRRDHGITRSLQKRCHERNFDLTDDLSLLIFFPRYKHHRSIHSSYVSLLRNDLALFHHNRKEYPRARLYVILAAYDPSLAWTCIEVSNIPWDSKIVVTMVRTHVVVPGYCVQNLSDGPQLIP